MEFEYITLTRKEYARLKKLSKSPLGLPTAPHETNLVNNRLISRTRYGSTQPDAEAPYTIMSSITQEGKNYILYRKQKRSANNRTIFADVISVLALLIAIISLCLDLC